MCVCVFARVPITTRGDMLSVLEFESLVGSAAEAAAAATGGDGLSLEAPLASCSSRLLAPLPPALAASIGVVGDRKRGDDVAGIVCVGIGVWRGFVNGCLAVGHLVDAQARNTNAACSVRHATEIQARTCSRTCMHMSNCIHKSIPHTHRHGRSQRRTHTHSTCR